jgi:hypothetical protein
MNQALLMSRDGQRGGKRSGDVEADNNRGDTCRCRALIMTFWGRKIDVEWWKAREWGNKRSLG